MNRYEITQEDERTEVTKNSERFIGFAMLGTILLVDAWCRSTVDALVHASPHFRTMIQGVQTGQSDALELASLACYADMSSSGERAKIVVKRS